MGDEGPLGMRASGRAMSDLFVPVPPTSTGGRTGPQGPAARECAPATATRVPRSATLWLIGCALVPLLAAGCAMNDGVSRVVEVGPRQFNSAVLQSQQPVLVNFYKPG